MNDGAMTTVAGWKVSDLKPRGWRGLLELPNGSRCSFDWRHDGTAETYHVREENLDLEDDAIPSASRWQTIDTAPRDGTRVLVAHHMVYVPVVAVFTGKEWVEPNGAVRLSPTHWMPLPPTPVGKTEG